MILNALKARKAEKWPLRCIWLIWAVNERLEIVLVTGLCSLLHAWYSTLPLSILKAWDHSYASMLGPCHENQKSGQWWNCKITNDAFHFHPEQGSMPELCTHPSPWLYWGKVSHASFLSSHFLCSDPWLPQDFAKLNQWIWVRPRTLTHSGARGWDQCWR